MIKEIWKDVVGYEGYYQVSNLGRVRSLDRMVRGSSNNIRIAKGRMLKFCDLKDGYLGVGLHKCGKALTKSVHRVVIEAFADNLENKPTVNHKDGNKHNNCIDNLEWSTYSENNLHAYKTGLNKSNIRRCKKVNQYDLNGNFIKQWDSMTLASKETKTQCSKICLCCQNFRNQTGGYKWKYANL